MPRRAPLRSGRPEGLRECQGLAARGRRRGEGGLAGPGNADPFRAAPLSLSGIPTLVAVDEQGKEIGRVGAELEATGSEAEAAEVAGAFVGKFK